MTDAARNLIAAGAALAFVAVGLGAFGAHALKAQLSAEMLAVYQTGVQYHLPHAIAVVLIGVLASQMPASKLLPVAGWAMVVGVVIFSGSLYALSVTGIRMLGAITPIGGVALLVAWAMVAYATLTYRPI
jgi:uncharacterized membrane protein YgdD (TMEM256/DUF423 family)